MYRPCSIAALPVELLSSIFVLATHSSLDNFEAPLAFCAVNRHWKSIALSTPALWTNICATIGSNNVDSYLARSKSYPLDILIDGRDPRWDFSEPEIPSAYEYSTYVPPFQDMAAVITTLLLHLRRWRSLVVLTDTWAPMHQALTLMNPALAMSGAPALESLTLMRCNEYVSYSPEFQPPGMKFPAFLGFEPSTAAPELFPKLNLLSLRGVHLDWNAFPRMKRGSLQTLDLSFHSPDVRPSMREFWRILKECPELRKLVVHGSGPVISEAPEKEEMQVVELLNLEELVLGYRSQEDGSNILQIIHAPNLTTLSFEDATHPGDIDEVDAGGLLRFLATGILGLQHDPVITFVVAPGLQISRDDKGHVVPSKSTAEIIPFPRLERLTMRRVKAHQKHFTKLFDSLACLRRLELVSMSPCAVAALLPRVGYPCPCPKLKTLCIRGFDQLEMADFGGVISGLTVGRVKHGAAVLNTVDVYLDCVAESILQDMIRVSSRFGTIVKLFDKVPPAVNYDSEEGEIDEIDLEEDAFQLGGAFNDPLFDAFYSSATLAL
ncbi:hypothetical protein C8J56DRAFT_958360 [Mycena floridula]|nr:hypothetical protein C8J56DRAFT_958360 [Mycena floridula]